MPEIHTVAVITAKPEAAEQVADAMRALAEATHAEPGCLLYSLHRGAQDPNVFVTIEKWDSPESLEQHLASPHVTATIAAAQDLLAAPLQIIPAIAVQAGDPAKSTF